MTRHELGSTVLWMLPAVRRGARANYSGLRRPRRTRHAPLTGQPFIQRLSSIGHRRLVPAVGFQGLALSDLTATKKNHYSDSDYRKQKRSSPCYWFSVLLQDEENAVMNMSTGTKIPGHDLPFP